MLFSDFIITLNGQPIATNLSSHQPISTNFNSQKHSREPADLEVTKKAIYAYAINKCPQPRYPMLPIFGGSDCDRSTGSTRTWLVTCHNYSDIKPIYGHCWPGYGCIDSPLGLAEGVLPTALCISHDTFQRFETSPQWGALLQIAMIVQNVEAVQSHFGNLAVMLTNQGIDGIGTDQDSEKSNDTNWQDNQDAEQGSLLSRDNDFTKLRRRVIQRNQQLNRRAADSPHNATLITLEPKDSDNNTLGQRISCTRCSSLSYFKWPTGTTHIHSNITLSNPNHRAVVSIYGWTN